jgi:6-phosphofructokinase 1
MTTEKAQVGTVAVDTAIQNLGEARHDNPLSYCRFVPDQKGRKVRVDLSELDEFSLTPPRLPFEAAGPRSKIFFDPRKTKCAIVTCGGLCPGINDVIRSLVLEAYHSYKVAACLGIRFGLQGFIPSFGHDVLELTPDTVADIHKFGGTILGSSRGPQPAEDIVDALERMNIDILFVIGGDGSMRANRTLVEEIRRRDLAIAVIGIPKTIDNDISFITRSFGFDTAVEKATQAIACAHVEAVGAYNGIGIVKVMGRNAGFIAAQAALALKEVNFVLVPEYPFELYGERGLIPALEARLRERHHSVVLVAEGAGQHLLNGRHETDASGNVRLGDICQLLMTEIRRSFDHIDLPHTIKFIDPSYIIRSVPANANDRVYCGFLGQNAVHAGMAGKTAMVVARLQDRFVHLPMELVTRAPKRLDIGSGYWRAVIETTGQNEITPNTGPYSEACLIGATPR